MIRAKQKVMSVLKRFIMGSLVMQVTVLLP